MKHYDCWKNGANAEMERTNGHNVTVWNTHPIIIILIIWIIIIIISSLIFEGLVNCNKVKCMSVVLICVHVFILCFPACNVFGPHQLLFLHSLFIYQLINKSKPLFKLHLSLFPQFHFFFTFISNNNYKNESWLTFDIIINTHII